MDLLDPKNSLNLNDSSWLIYTEDVSTLPQYIGKEAKIKRAYITQGVRVEGSVTNSVLFTGTVVGKGAKVIDSVLMPGAVVEEGAIVTRALVAENVRIGKKVKIGSKNSENIELVAKNVKGGTK
jgi:glucose-1-phosphate adenylyltransferase